MNSPKYILDLPAAVGLFPAGQSVIERQHAAKLLSMPVDATILRLEPEDYRPLRVFGANDGETILFVRPGGFGDLLFLTPTFRALKEQFPTCRIVVSSIEKYGAVLEGNPDVDEIVTYPPSLAKWREADTHVWLERILEDGEDAKTVPAVEMIAAEAGVRLEDFSMRYTVTEDESAWAKAEYPKGGRGEGETRGHGESNSDLPSSISSPATLRIGVQVNASAENRTYPHGNLNRVMNMLNERGCEVFLFGEPGEFEAEEPFVNLTAQNLTFRQSAAVLATCDVVITPDSSLCHVAGALAIPTVALYGPFSSSTRTIHQPSVAAIDGVAPCAPCHHLGNSGQPWPKDCPGWKTGRCAALSNITPERVVRTVFLLVAGVAPLQTINHPTHGRN